MKKNEKGFTLIELLAVIVILALLMMIAIPSVTRYITQSRVKTVTKTMDSYITAVVQEVNDGEYKFSDSTKIYAIPIECVSLEKGGTNPFGEWMQANDNYWAYVLVQYDSENYNYKYGFTFKDSAGYGMYPTISSKIDEKSSKVKTGYDDLTKPTSDKAVNFVSADKWDGFEITDDTELIVLESESEGNTGNGETTCTLGQKGDNYEDIEQEKEDRKICVSDSYEVGAKVNCASENFYIVESDENTITVLTEYAINPDLNNPVQNQNATYVAYDDDNYWAGDNLKNYGEYYPVYVYDVNSDLYQYVEAYEKYLRSEKKVNSADAKLISYEQLVSLGCVPNLYSGDCKSAPSWVYSPGGYWTGSADNKIQLWQVWPARFRPGTDLYSSIWNTTARIRPIVTISKTEIKIEK